MQDLQIYVKTICAVSIFSSVLCLLISEKYKKVFYAFCSVILVYCSVMPVLNFKIKDFRFEGSELSDLSQSISRKADAFQNEVNKDVIDEQLRNYISEKGYDVIIDTSMVNKDGESEITSVSVYGSFSEKQKQEIKDIILSSVSDKTEVLFSAEQ